MPASSSQKGSDPQVDDLTSLVSEIRQEIVALKREVSDLKGTSASTEDSALSPEELDAILAATSQLHQAEEATSLNENITQAAEGETTGTVLSDEEIESLLAGAQPKAQNPADIVSADDIKAMLGLREQGVDGEDAGVKLEEAQVDSAPESSEPVEAIAPQIEPAEAPTEPAETVPPQVEVDFDHIGLDALDKVPGEMAASALALPACIVGDELHVLTPEPFDTDALNALSQSISMKCVPHPASLEKVVHQIRVRYGLQDLSQMERPETPQARNLFSRFRGRSA